MSLALLTSCGRWVADKRHPIAVVFASAGVMAAAGFLLALIPGYDKVLAVIGNVEPAWFVLCFVAECVAYLGYVLAFREAARVGGGPDLGVGHSAKVVAAGFGAFFSASTAGGFELDYRSLRHAGATRRDAFVRVLGLGTLEYAVLAPLALASAVALLLGAGKQPYFEVTLPWLLVIPGIAVAVWVTSPRRAHLGRTDATSRFKRGFAHGVAGLTMLRSLVVAPRRHGLAFVGTALYWFGEILCLWASLRAFHADVAIPALILAYATGYVLTRRALPFGGAGVAEALLTVALVSLGVPFAAALVGVFAYRLVNFWLALVPALLVSRTAHRIRAAIDPSAP